MFSRAKSFYLDNMKLIHKFLLNQFAISLFGFMVIIALSAMSRSAMIVATVCSALFFAALLYDSAWDEGIRDRSKITNGRLTERPFHGAAVALFSYIPTLIFVLPTVALSLLSAFGVNAVDGALTVLSAISLFLCNGMYLGFSYLLAEIFPNMYHLFFLAYLLPAIFAYGLGYYLGIKDVQIKTMFGMKPSTNKPKNR